MTIDQRPNTYTSDGYSDRLDGTRILLLRLLPVKTCEDIGYGDIDVLDVLAQTVTLRVVDDIADAENTWVVGKFERRVRAYEAVLCKNICTKRLDELGVGVASVRGYLANFSTMRREGTLRETHN